MFDARLRPLVDRTTAGAGRWLHARGIGADSITLGAAALGLLGALAIAAGAPLLGFILVVANRVGDGIDGAVARLAGPTDRGGFLDIVLDFAVYAAVPLAFAIADPQNNARAAACLLAAFLVNGAAFFAFALMAERRGLSTRAQGEKSFFYLAGLTEGAETIAAFCLMCLLPAWFAPIALAFAVGCTISAIARIAMAWQMLGRR